MDKDFVGHLHHDDSLFYYQITMKKAYQALDPTPYTEILQQIFDIYVKELGHIFATQPIIYLLEKLKCKYASWFLEGIPLDNWDNYQRCIKVIDVLKYNYGDFLKMHQDYLNPKHIKQFNMIICIKRIA